MSIVSRIDLLRTAVDNLKTDIAAADGSTALKNATKDLASRLAEDVEALTDGPQADLVRARANAASQ